MFQDRKLVCKECGEEFIFSAQEQENFAEKGYTNNPGRCKKCLAARKANGVVSNKNYRTENAVMHDVICSECGSPTQVPFKPKNDRPIYC